MITINGESTKLRGFKRHDMYPQVGPTVPESIYASDIALLKSLGANFVRGCHYPQDERFLDMCDEQGIMIWNEALAWGNYWQQLTDPAFMKAELATANAMVDAAVNHPSVILWVRRYSKVVIAHPDLLSPHRAFSTRASRRTPMRLPRMQPWRMYSRAETPHVW